MLESEFSNLAVTSDEKQQTGWFDLPYEMRSMIIEMMDTQTKGKLSSCSKLCCKEVRQSKNFINTIKLTWLSISACLEVDIQDHKFNMNFAKIEDKCSISYQSYSNIGWDETVDRSIDDVVIEQFRRLVKDAIHLKFIIIKSDSFPFEEISIRHLTKLDSIIIEKTGEVDLLECEFLSINQLVNASKTVEIENTVIEFDKLINFKASNINLKNANFSPTQLNQYLKSWMNNEIDQNVKRIRIVCSTGVNLCDVSDEIVSGFDVVRRQFFSFDKWFTIKSNAGKLVDLRLTEDSFLLSFEAEFDVFDRRSYHSGRSSDSDQFHDLDYIDYPIDDDSDDYDDYVDALYNDGDDDY